MEDWEQFFAEKSRRRAEKERSEQRRRRRGSIIVFGLALVLLVGLLIALTLLRQSGFE